MRRRQMAGVRVGWGLTLSLAYAQTHLERVTELVLRGIFLFGQTDFDWLYRYGASELYPAVGRSALPCRRTNAAI